METKHTFTFKDGFTVPIQFVKYTFVARVRSAARKRAVEEHGEPTAPTFTTTAAGGSEYEQDHSEESLQREPYKDDEELQDAWREYKATQLAIDVEINRQTCRAYCIRGVVGEPSEKWLEEQTYWGLEVPEDARDCKFEWLLDCSTGWDELLDLVIAIQEINPIEEAAEAAEEGFPDSMATGAEEPNASTGEGEAEGISTD